jgi:hypothetical protein
LKSSPTGKFERKSCEELIKTCLLCAQRPRMQFLDPFVLADIVAMGWDTRGDIFVHNMDAVPHFIIIIHKYKLRFFGAARCVDISLFPL